MMFIVFKVMGWYVVVVDDVVLVYFVVFEWLGF